MHIWDVCLCKTKIFMETNTNVKICCLVENQTKYRRKNYHSNDLNEDEVGLDIICAKQDKKGKLHEVWTSLKYNAFTLQIIHFKPFCYLCNRNDLEFGTFAHIKLAKALQLRAAMLNQPNVLTSVEILHVYAKHAHATLQSPCQASQLYTTWTLKLG